MQEKATNMEEGFTISCNAVFSHRRNSSQCHGAFINQKMGKLLLDL